MTYEAIVYGWFNINNGKRYVGFHQTENEDDNYNFSSKDFELKHAWSNGLLRKSVIWRGSREECLALEHYILSKVKAASNPKWYNNNQGGGKGMGSVEDLSESAISSATKWLNTKEVINEDNSALRVANHNLVMRVKQRIESGYYDIVEANVEELSILPRNQVRLEQFDQKHVDSIEERMVSDPARARNSISPIIICVEIDRQLILDGNHTSYAALKAGWTNIPAIYINSSEFEDSQANYDDFGYEMNHQEKIKKGNTKEDCKKAILNLYDRIGGDINSKYFSDVCLANLNRYWSPNEISGNLLAIKKNIKEEEILKTHNFKKWTNDEVSAEVKKLDKKYNPGSEKNIAIIGISSNASYNNGVGAILNKLGEMGVTKGIMLISHNSLDNYEKRHDHERKLKNALKYVRSDIDIEIRYLPSFIDTKTYEFRAA